MRFRILPDPEAGTLHVELWEGPWACEFSTVELTGQFPLSQQGLDALSGWLLEQQREIDARPPRSLEEHIARRVEK